MVPWDEYRYAAFARRFGWTPEQVDNLPLTFEGWVWPIMSALDDAEERQREKMEQDAQRRHNKFGRRRR